MEQDKQPLRSAIEHTVVLCSEVAAQLSQLAIDLGAVRERKMRDLVAEQVETGDLVAQRNTTLLVERLEELADRFGPVRGAQPGGDLRPWGRGLLAPPPSTVQAPGSVTCWRIAIRTVREATFAGNRDRSRTSPTAARR